MGCLSATRRRARQEPAHDDDMTSSCPGTPVLCQVPRAWQGDLDPRKMLGQRKASGLWRSPPTTDGDPHLGCQIDSSASSVLPSYERKRTRRPRKLCSWTTGEYWPPWPPRHLMRIYRPQDGEKNGPCSNHLRVTSEQQAPYGMQARSWHAARKYL